MAENTTPRQAHHQEDVGDATETDSVLIIGLGELGNAILSAILEHPLFSPPTSTSTVSNSGYNGRGSNHNSNELANTNRSTTITVLVRPTTLSNPTPHMENITKQHPHILFVAADLATDTMSHLTEIFSAYTTVIHAGSMTLPPGTQLKITQAVLDTQGKVKLYVPWQFGVDYDVIGREGGLGLFREQCDVRDLLRQHRLEHRQRQLSNDNEVDHESAESTWTGTRWLIISNGIFMSFLFEEFWGVVSPALFSVISSQERRGGGEEEEEQDSITVTALGSPTDLLTVTTATDIGRCLAQLLYVDNNNKEEPSENPTYRDTCIYISGQTLTYNELADTIERVCRRHHEQQQQNQQQQNQTHNQGAESNPKIKINRQTWSTPHLRHQSEQDPHNKLLRYRVVFSEGKGLAWLDITTDTVAATAVDDVDSNAKSTSEKDHDRDRRVVLYNVDKGIEMTGVEEWLYEEIGKKRLEQKD